MQTAFLIFLGGGAGSVLRWLTGLGATRLFGTGFPMGTLAVNLVGCFVMGLLARLLLPADAGGADARFLLMTGVLGAIRPSPPSRWKPQACGCARRAAWRWFMSACRWWDRWRRSRSGCGSARDG
jgi:hypothetical protein